MRLADANITHMAGGFLLMGGWAALAHAQYDGATQFQAAVTQGTLSAVITLGLKRLVETVEARIAGPMGLILPPCLAAACSVTLLFTIHSLVGTPEVWKTLAVPSTVATIYATLHTFRLRRTS